MAPGKQTLYEILDVPREANEIDVGLAYERRRRALENAAPPDPSALALLHEAYEVLGDARRRQAYDESLVGEAEKAAARAQAHAPDLVLEPEEDQYERRQRWLMPAIAGAAVLMLLAFVFLRTTDRASAPATTAVTKAPATQPATKAPAAPPVMSPPEILAEAMTGGGRLFSHEMSGRSAPVGVALGIERGGMVTTCHGLPAGAKLVVRIGEASHPAELSVTDEALNLCKLSVSGFITRPLAVAAEEPRAGERIWAVGVNSAGEFAATEGTIKAVHGVRDGRVLELSMPVAPGASGHGVFDVHGRLVAIASTRSEGITGPAAIPATAIGQMRSRSAAGAK